MSCHFPLQGNLPTPGMEPTSLASHALAGRFFPDVPPGKTLCCRLGDLGQTALSCLELALICPGIYQPGILGSSGSSCNTHHSTARPREAGTLGRLPAGPVSATALQPRAFLRLTELGRQPKLLTLVPAPSQTALSKSIFHDVAERRRRTGFSAHPFKKY